MSYFVAFFLHVLISGYSIDGCDLSIPSCDGNIAIANRPHLSV